VSGVENVQVDRRGSVKSSQNGGRRSKHRRALAERASADGLTQKAIEALRTSEGWQRWLQVRTHLGHLDLRNQLLVAYQRPGAEKVAGTRGWLSLGYEVRSDERPIQVWARVPASKAALREWEEAGSVPEEKPGGDLRLAPVFDQDQVRRLPEGPEPAEEESAPPSSEANNLISLLGQLIKFASEIGSPVNFEPIASAVRGYHEPGTGEIVIDASPDFPPAARAARLIYELAMVLIDEDPRRPGLKFCDGESEVVARSVAYCVCAFAGFSGNSEPIAVPAEWSVDSAVAVRYAAVVDRVAGRLEAALLSGLEGGPR
jgi:hypothetical protein